MPLGRHHRSHQVKVCTFNTLRLRQNGRHFADDTFKPIFMKENIRISIKISLKFVPKVPINNIPAMVQIMAWRRPGDKPLSEPMVVSLPTHVCVVRPQWVNTTSICKAWALNIYIFIYIYVCVCMCGCGCVCVYKYVNINIHMVKTNPGVCSKYFQMTLESHQNILDWPWSQYGSRLKMLHLLRRSCNPVMSGTNYWICTTFS